ncbi:MAG: hypothetical protein WCV59_00085 [Parcubacteria group bacterium]|jgi:hypothetical protein
MTLKAYIWIGRLLSLLSLASLVLIINYIGPDDYGWQGKAIFYLILGLFLTGFFSLVMLFIRRKTLGEDSAGKNARLSMRQGMLLALLTIALLILQSFRMLVWWDGLLVVAAVFLVELYFLSRN